mmetsp:Transcript_44267/g.102247  ORF Transcript_44267/g.102247 Transcript_44267/m.102247 type:complete len:140 (+) Transcript_44267:68-487(+)|eukprot:209229-Amphidinium_carterae.1
MSNVHSDKVWRNRMAKELKPLDAGIPMAAFQSRRNPVSWSYGEATPSDSRLATAASSRSGLRSSRSLSSFRPDSSAAFRMSTAGSRLGTAGSSIASQAIRSSVLSLELESERQLREQAEREIARLQAELARRPELLTAQ